ncbi:sulfate respiration complex hexadecaheme cytochrome HmcA [Maridesulfovibrio sp.]|uniref:sulfate respiration complex hexadecaheme cytochrome HmcA n=1 Tax=Maridesulfovibrio sp. TaxID=2795000 RepID=UPI002A18C740|nr:cytochrome c3 family protein [Maridesulfovibrio sp.]
MANGKKLLRLSGILIVLAGVLCFHMEALSMVGTPQENGNKRPDLIMIDTIAAQEKPEMPAVVFLHEAHSKAVAEQGKDCTACHQKKDGAMSYKYNRLQDGTPEQLKEIYHNGCISCHTAQAAEGKKTGPKVGECRSCHVADPEVSADRVPAGMDNTLHYRHWSSKLIAKDKGEDTNCGKCHHVYNKLTRKLEYVKGQEDNCSVCHTAKPEGDVKLNTSEAYHGECVSCHLEMKAAKAEKTGPVDCAGCHGKEKAADLKEDDAALMKKLGGTLPRLPRKQPDAVLLTAPIQENVSVKASMASVSFDHKAHENYTDSCTSCHHETMNKSCSTCHTVRGSKEGGFVTLEQAMHKAGSTRSCVGCHAVKQKDPKCAGCHELMPGNAVKSEDTCKVCHNGPAPASKETAAMDASAKAAIAQSLILERPAAPQLVDEKDIPEFVTINVLENEYKASKLPHRKIIMSMVGKIKDDKMATTFHSTPLSVCGSCHHNSPASATPPSCASCHGGDYKTRDGRPGLKAAYHVQCMSCHENMGLKKPASTDCTACHAKKQ